MPRRSELATTAKIGHRVHPATLYPGLAAHRAVARLHRDLEAATNDVRDRVARAIRDLPEEVEDPVVAKRDSDARPILWMALSGDGHDPIALTQMADKLKDAGKPYELVALDGEDHWLSLSATRRQMLDATMEFVQKHNPAE